MCVNITVVADGLIEADESFNVHASILDQNSARFGNGSQTFGNMEVIIRDDDGTYNYLRTLHLLVQVLRGTSEINVFSLLHRMYDNGE